MTLLERRRVMMAQSKKKEEYLFNNARAYKVYGGSHNGKACQGGCVVGDKWFSITVSADDTTQYLYCYDMTAKTFTLLNTYTTLGHANSLTYNNRENVFYAATGYANLGLAVIDGTTYAHTDTFQTSRLDGTPYAPWHIAYDRRRNLLYSVLSRDGTLVVNSTSGANVSERAFIGYVSHTTAQGIETDGEYIYIVWSSPSNVIDVYKLSGEYVKTISIPSLKSGSYYEVEEMGYDWNGRFYTQAFGGSTAPLITIGAILFRSFDGWANMSYVPWNCGNKRTDNATLTYTGIDSLVLASNGAKSYYMYAIGAGYPFSYDFLKGKTCRVSYDLIRVAGSGGSFASNVFTANTDTLASLSNRLFQKGKYVSTATTLHEEYTFVWGEEGYTPASGKEGTYVGYAVFIYADSGNTYEMRNFKYEVNLS